MRALVVYESMYGNTRQIAGAIGEGCRSSMPTSVVHVSDANPRAFADLSLLIVGGPTHAWSMSRPRTRQAAVAQAKPGGPVAEVAASDVGIRELLKELPRLECLAAAFDTRIKAPALLTGRASRPIAHGLHHHGMHVIAPPKSFFVNKDNRLLPGELVEARAWGASLAAHYAVLTDHAHRHLPT